MDGEHYDPDRMNADDLDPDNLDQLNEWLDHPSTEAFHADLGRAFRVLSAEEQIDELEAQVAKFEMYCLEVVAALEGRGADNAGEAQLTLLARLEGAIAAMKARIDELRGEPR